VKLKPTDEQVEIISAATNESTSLSMTAFAGCGKTSTLEMVSSEMPPKPSLALAFNVKNKKELEKRFPDHFNVKTLNGLGHSAWGNAIGKRLIIEEKKLGKLVTSVTKEAGFRATSDDWNDLRRLVSSAMQLGLVPKEFEHYKSLVPDTEETWQEIADINYIDLGDYPERQIGFARTILSESIKQSFAGVISFDDQIYMSAMFMGSFPRFPLVMVDEAQDLSPLNHIQVKKCAAERLIVVGDPKQAIYQFRGAASDSIQRLLRLRKDWINLPLATTFRCPKSIVSRQQHHAPGFKAWHTNPEGEILTLGNGWNWGQIPQSNSIAILCRNNAPLLSMAFKLLRQGIGCHMLGRDIGKGLIALAKKILSDESTPATECVVLINDWMTREHGLAMANGDEDKAARQHERGECLLAVLHSADVSNAKGLCDALTSLFARTEGLVTLSTGHKAKGMEWSTVIHLDPWRLPSKQAKVALSRGNPIPMEQERNLLYVIETRAQHTLILASLEGME
jgi:DNA helicase II / ATP-dependent DNA helicase PcrA